MTDLFQNIFRPARWMINQFSTPAIILIYHRVTNLEQDPQQLRVSPENFYEQIKWMKAQYNIISADEFAFYLLQQKKFPPKTILLTFDDGYADNSLEALPILESLDATALFYITTSLLGTNKELWWDELERILLEPNNLPTELTVEIENKKYHFITNTTQKRKHVYYQLQSILRFCTPDIIQHILQQLRQWASLNENGRISHRMMAPDELYKMSQSKPATIGCHTHHHPALGMLPYKKQLEEIKLSKEIVEKIIGKPAHYFSYPFGAKKILGNTRYYNADSIRACKETGFKMVCANYYGQVHSWNNPYTLPRCLVRNWPLQEFQKNLHRFFSY